MLGLNNLRRLFLLMMSKVWPFKVKDTISRVFSDRQSLMDKRKILSKEVYLEQLRKLDNRYNVLVKDLEEDEPNR